MLLNQSIAHLPIIGKGFFLPVAAFTIPIIQRTKTIKPPIGRIMNHPMKGIIEPTMLTTIAAMNSIKACFA